jgi:hypothetical protein
MRRHWHRVVAPLAAAVLAAVATGSEASAVTDVLTVGSVGGPNVAVGDTLSASGTSSLCSTADGTCFRCSTTFSGTVSTNPPAPGTAEGTVDSIALSGCTTTIAGCTLLCVTLSNLPYLWSVGSTGTVTVSPGSSGAIRIAFTIVCSGLSFTCAYRVHDPSGNVVGGFFNSDSTIRFTNVQFDKVSGPNVCFASGLFNAKLKVNDHAQGDQPVFVN